MKNKDIAISVKNISKTFRIPHEKVTSLRGAFVRGVSPLWKRGAREIFLKNSKPWTTLVLNSKKEKFRK